MYNRKKTLIEDIGLVCVCIKYSYTAVKKTSFLDYHSKGTDAVFNCDCTNYILFSTL